MTLQKLFNQGNKGILPFSLIFMLFAAHIPGHTQNSTIEPHVYHIQNYFTEAYLVRGNNGKLILIDTGVPIAG